MSCRLNQAALARYVQHAGHGRVVVFDTETTGLDRLDQVVQIAAAEYVNGTRTRTLNLFVRPTCPVSPGAEAVHHISQEFLDEHGLDPREALRQFFAFVGEDALLVGHNVRFDLGMLRNECREFGYPATPEAFFSCDTVALARRFVPGLPHYRLCTLIEALGLDGRNSHDALDDTLACGELFFDLVRRIPMAPEDPVYQPLFDF